MRSEVTHQLHELEWLLDGGTYPPDACARVGWNIRSATKAAYRRGEIRVARILSAHYDRAAA